MKYLSLIIILTAFTITADAQTTTGGTAQTTQKKTQINKQEKKRVQRGTGQYHGSRDTTPGSPMGTGGAGGDMSGSPAASAIETDDQTDKAQVDNDSTNSVSDSADMSDTTVKKSTIRKTKSVHSKSRRH